VEIPADGDHPLTIVGMPGSPYSRKLRAVLRYRRIPHAWVHQFSPEARGLPRPRVELLPQLLLPGPDGGRAAHTDSTPLIRRLEAMQAGRRVIPPDPAIAFLDALLEDYADEWLTKAMFHYRWAFAPDAAQAAAILPRWARTDGPEDEAVRMGRMFSERQIGRLGVVGSNAVTAPVIEASYHRLLALLDARLTESRFVLGGRPGCADFGLYGQLTQLAGFDPTPRAPGGGRTCLRPVPPRQRGRARARCRAGRVHDRRPALGAAAVSVGAQVPRVAARGESGARPDDRRCVDAILAGTGCEALFPA